MSLRKVSRREFGVGSLSLAAAATFGGCVGGGITVAKISGARIAEGLFAGVATYALTEAGQWSSGWAADKLDEAVGRTAERGYSEATTLRGVVTARTHALFYRRDGAGRGCVGVVPYTQDRSDLCLLDSDAFIIAASELAKMVADDNRSMSHADVADTVVPIRPFAGLRSASLEEPSFGTWDTEVGAVSVDFDPDRGFRCRLLDVNKNLYDYEFKVDVS